MSEALPVSTVDRVTTSGLEDLLSPTLDTKNTDHGQALVDDWNLEEAAEYLSLSIKTIRRKLRDGKLDGYKIQGANGPEWRIRQTALDNDQGTARPWSNRLSTVQGTDLSTLDNSLVKELLAKVEALTYRNGYLEAQLQERETQIKLLTDSQHKTNWWQRFGKWFAGTRDRSESIG